MLFKSVEVFPIPKMILRTIVTLLEREVRRKEVRKEFLRWEFPQRILTYNAPQFRGQRWASLCEC
jgi:hypothetical protein